jgi:hypothetical protein
MPRKKNPLHKRRKAVNSGESGGAASAASASSAPASAPISSVTHAEQQLVARAMRKMQSRQELTRDERNALKRYEKDKEERLRWQYYRSIPQKHWREMSGRQTKVINEQASRYGLPLGGPFVDLTKLSRAIHDFLADNAIKLAREEDPMMAGGAGSPSLEMYREEKAKLARLDRLQREGELMPRSDARAGMGRVAALLRRIGDYLQRTYGSAAMDAFYEALDDAEREIHAALGDGDAQVDQS